MKYIVNNLFEYQFDISHNLLNNFRIMCQKAPEQTKYIIPEKYYAALYNGEYIPIQAEYYSPSSHKYYKIDLTTVLSEQLGEVLLRDSVHKEKPILHISVEGYRSAPDGKLVIVESADSFNDTANDGVLSIDSPKDEPPKDEPPKDEPPKDEPPKDEPPKNRAILFKRGLSLCFLLLVVIALGLWFTRDTSIMRIQNALEDADYPSVVEIYNEEIFGNTHKQQKVDPSIITEIGTISTNYESHAIDYDSCQTWLTTLSEVNSPELFDCAVKHLIISSLSEGMYSDAVSLYNQTTFYNSEIKTGIDSMLINCMDEQKTLYSQHTLSFDEVKSVFDTFATLKDKELSNRAAIYMNFLTNEDKAQKQYNVAVKLVAAKKYKEAIVEFQKVSDSSSIYSSVQDGIDESCKGIINQYGTPNTIDEYLTAISECSDLYQEISLPMIADAIQQWKNDCASLLTKKIQKYESDNEYDSALNLIATVSDVYETDELLSLKSEVEKKKAEYYVSIPNLVGMTVDKAKSTLQDNNLSVGNISYSNTSNEKKGTIMSHDTGNVAPNSSVDLVVGKYVRKVNLSGADWYIILVDYPKNKSGSINIKIVVNGSTVFNQNESKYDIGYCYEGDISTVEVFIDGVPNYDFRIE